MAKEILILISRRFFNRKVEPKTFQEMKDYVHLILNQAIQDRKIDSFEFPLDPESTPDSFKEIFDLLKVKGKTKVVVL